MKQSVAGKARGGIDTLTPGEQKDLVARHIALLAARASSAQDGEEHLIPDYLTGVRKQYLEAVQAEARAKKAFEDSRVIKSFTEDSVQQPDDDVLLNHVNSLRQRQQHARLDTLSHYVDEFEKLVPHRPEKREDGTSQGLDPAAETDLHDQRQEDGLLTRKLEIAVFEAKSRAGTEKMALQRARAGLSAADISPASRLEALTAVRTELTAWIEENLAACGLNDLRLDVETVEHEQSDHTSLKDIEEAYEQYLEARKRLVAATGGLSTPLPALGEETAKPARVKAILESDNAAAAEDQLSRWQHKRSIAAFKSYSQTQLVEEREEAAATLQRLVDESQLLPSYPMLAKSGRFNVATTKRQQDPTDEIASQVQSWAFAAEAADIATHSVADRDVHRGNEAIDRAGETLKDMAALQNSAAKAID